MNIIILGDKYQKRMKSRGCVGLIKYNNKNIFTHQYKTILSTLPSAQIIYVYGFDSKRFLTYFDKHSDHYPNITLINNDKYELYNNAYGIYLAQEYLNDDCIILFGDHIVKPSLFDHFRPTTESQIFVNRKAKTRLGCVINNNIVENISYDLENYLSEIYYISKDQIDLFRDLVSNPKNHNNFIFEIVNKMIDLKQSIKPFYIHHKQYA
jgi:choline kinase